MILVKLIVFLLWTNKVIGTETINDSFESEPCAETCTCHEGSFNVWKSNTSIPLYRPVVMIHGINSSSESLTNLLIRIKKLHPRTQIFNLNCFKYMFTIISLWTQIETYGKEVMAIGKAFPQGIHLLGFSQGGVIARGILQLFPKHNVRNFISLAAPQRGIRPTTNQTDDTKVQWLVNIAAVLSRYDKVNHLIHDPYSQEVYMEKNDFLPVFNNELDTLQQSKYKRGIIRLQMMVLIGGPDDQLLVPWESCHFGFYAPANISESLRIIPLYETDMYINDKIGLKTLDKAKRLRIHTVPNVGHLSWHSNEQVIDQYILPYLT